MSFLIESGFKNPSLAASVSLARAPGLGPRESAPDLKDHWFYGAFGLKVKFTEEMMMLIRATLLSAFRADIPAVFSSRRRSADSLSVVAIGDPETFLVRKVHPHGDRAGRAAIDPATAKRSASQNLLLADTGTAEPSDSTFTAPSYYNPGVLPLIDYSSLLGCLTRERLVEVGRSLGVALPLSARKERQIEAFLGAAPAQLAPVVNLLQRDELKVICRQHGLPDGGRVRLELARRVLAAAGESDAAPTPAFATETGSRELPRPGDVVVQELRLRKRLDFVLMVCLAAICRQWRDELWRRFGLYFEIVSREFVANRRQDRGFADNPWAIHTRFVISHQLPRRPEYRDPLLVYLGERARKSLLVLDEAHVAAPAVASRYAVDSRITEVIRDVAPRYTQNAAAASPQEEASDDAALFTEDDETDFDAEEPEAPVEVQIAGARPRRLAPRPGSPAPARGRGFLSASSRAMSYRPYAAAVARRRLGLPTAAGPKAVGRRCFQRKLRGGRRGMEVNRTFFNAGAEDSASHCFSSRKSNLVARASTDEE